MNCKQQPNEVDVDEAIAESFPQAIRGHALQ